MIGAILLAAGCSRRMGAANKLLMPWVDRSMVAHVAGAIRSTGLPLLAVLGHEAEEVQTAIGRETDFVTAPDWAEGMGRSVAAGVRAAPDRWTGALICLGDMPFVAPADYAGLASAICSPYDLAFPVHGGRRGNPVGFGRAWFPALGELTGDLGARAIIAAAAVREVPAGPGVLRDLDRPEDFAAVP